LPRQFIYFGLVLLAHFLRFTGASGKKAGKVIDSFCLTRIRESLAVSTSRWQRWWRDFKTLLREEPVQQPPEVLTAWRELGSQHRDRIRIDPEETPPRSATDPKTFYELLRYRHGHSPAAAETLLDELYDLAAHEPAGKKLAECAMEIMPDHVHCLHRKITNHAVCTIQDAKGRVLASLFISGARDNHLRQRRLEQVANLQAKTRIIPEGESFAVDLWNKSAFWCFNCVCGRI
jgi:REP element-mobilizing transposase RayT